MLSYTEIRHIKATTQDVYNAVHDIKNYHRWNPWVVDGEGEIDDTSCITVTAAMGNKRAKFKHKMLNINAPHVFHWCDVGFFTVFAYGHRKRTFKDMGNGLCEYQCDLEVTGIGVFLAKLFFGEFMRKGMKAEADALQQYVEANNYKI